MKTDRISSIDRQASVGDNYRLISVRFEENENASFFADDDVDLDGIEKGDKVKYRTKVNQGNLNITEIRKVEDSGQDEPTDSTVRDRSKRISRGNAWNAASRIEDNFEDAKKTTERIYQDILKVDGVGE